MPVDQEQPPSLPFPVVGIGASAGGIEAMLDLLPALRADQGMAYVLIQHLSPDRESLVAEILAKKSPLPVIQVEEGMPIRPDHLYVIRPGHTLTIHQGAFRLGEHLSRPMHSRPIDDFFKSLAEAMRERAIAIVMSGMGSNGAVGAQAIKAVGGLCIAQDPETAKFPSMPRHLIDAGHADHVLAPRDIPDVLLAYASHPYARDHREAGLTALEQEQQHTPAAVTVDRDLRIVYFHGQTDAYLVQPRGEPTRDLMAMVRESLRGAVRSALHRAMIRGEAATVLAGTLELSPYKRIRVAITASPLDARSAPDCFVVSFQERGESLALAEGEERGETQSQEELQRVRDELQSAVEELQTSNEELKAAHEEMMSINEELQSTNEELATSREEMQSLNEELATINAQLQAKMDDHRAASDDLASLLASTDIAVLFLDLRFRIRRFTPQLKNLMEVIATDVGRPLSDLARKFDDPELISDATSVLDRLIPAEKEIAGYDGRWYLRRIIPYRTADNRIDGVVVAFLDITSQRRTARALLESEDRLQQAIHDAPIPMVLYGGAGEVLQLSRAWTELTGYGLREMPTIGVWLDQAVVGGAEDLRAQMAELAGGERQTLQVELGLRSRDGDERVWVFTATSLGTPSEGGRYVVGTAVDVTERRQAAAAIQSAHTSLGRQARVFDTTVSSIAVFAYTFDLEGRLVYANRALLEFWGLSPEEALGRTFRQLPYPWELGNRLHDEIRRVVESRTPVSGEVPYVSADGQICIHEYIFTPVLGTDGAPEAIAGSIRDVTERKQVEEALRVSEQRLSRELSAVQGLHAFTVRLGAMSELSAVLYAVLDSVLALTGTQKGNLQLLDRTTGKLVARVHRNLQPQFLERFAEIGVTDDTTCARALRSGSQAVLEDIQEDPTFETGGIDLGFRAVQSTPIKNSRGEVVGMLSTHHAEPRGFTLDELRLIELYARHAGDAIEQARGQEALRMSEARYRALFDQSAAGIAEVDLSGRLQMVNQRLCDLLGTPRDELLRRRFQDLTRSDDLPEDLQRFDRTVREGAPFEIERRLIRPDGSSVWVQISCSPIHDPAGRPIGAAAVMVDLTERQLAQQQLRVVVEGARDLALVMLDPEGRIVTWNAGAERLLGYRESEVLGRPVDLIFTEEDRQGGIPRQELAAAARGGRAEDERWHARKAGSRFWGRGVLTAVRGADGEIEGYVKVLWDDTDRKRGEEAILAAKESAEESSRIKDEFLATLGHELRTPLSSILIWSRILGTRGLGDAQHAEGLAAIGRAAQAQKQLIDDLLDTSRITSGKLRIEPRRVDLGSLLRDVVKASQPSAAAKGLRLDAEISDRIGDVWVDPDRIRQVISNLLVNAVKFTPSGGSVRLTASRSGREVEIRIRDTGEGIAPAFLPRIFQPFLQADGSTTRRVGGLGLGLAIVQRLVEQHGGTIRAESPGVGKGATFTARLPLPELPTVTEQPPASAPGGEISLADLRILVVEDDVETRLALQRTLTDAGAWVSAVGSAGAALESLASSGADLLVSDIGMAVEDGFDLIRRIRAREGERRLPAAALTAFASQAHQRQALEAGFDIHLGKPIEPEALVAALAALVGEGRE